MDMYEYIVMHIYVETGTRLTKLRENTSLNYQNLAIVIYLKNL